MIYSYQGSSMSQPGLQSDDYEIGSLKTNKCASKCRQSACVHCKSLKVRCEFDPGMRVCQRCQSGDHECKPRARKKRKVAPSHEDLEHRSNQQDLEIGNLLRQLEQMKADKQVKEWVARAQLDSNSESNSSDMGHCELPSRCGQAPDPEFAARKHFTGNATAWQGLAPPGIVKHCRLFPEEIIELFRIFFARVNPYFSLLDPELHTPDRLIWTSPFLFTVICAVAARYHSRKEVYSLAMDFARDAAGKALVEDVKNVDTCQAYLLMAVYPVQKKKWADDRSWLLMGVAIRMAIELELNQPSPVGTDERESLNRTRTWLNCYCVDGSHATQFGKMPMLRLDDFVARHSRDWHRSSAFNLPFDIHLVAYVEITKLMAEFRAERENAPLETAIPAALDLDEKLSELMAFWEQRYANDSHFDEPICAYRANTTQLITAYLRLVVLSSGFQSAANSELHRDYPIVEKSIKAARAVIFIMIDRLYPTHFLRYAMNANFLYVAFAAAFLINLLRPKFIHLLGDTQHREAIALVRQLINVLGSEGVALDGRHTPALYSRFLSSLLAKHNTCPSHFNQQTADASAGDIIPQYSEIRQQSPPNLCYWPDTYSTQQTSPDFPADPDLILVGEMHQNDVQIDLSVQHFLDTFSNQNPQPMVAHPTLNELDSWNMYIASSAEQPQAQYIEPYPELLKSLSYSHHA